MGECLGPVGGCVDGRGGGGCTFWMGVSCHAVLDVRERVGGWVLVWVGARLKQVCGCGAGGHVAGCMGVVAMEGQGGVGQQCGKGGGGVGSASNSVNPTSR